jgi:hypothetical protein
MSRTVAQCLEEIARLESALAEQRGAYEEQIKSWQTANRSLVQANEILQTRSIELQERNQFLETRNRELEAMIAAREDMERTFVNDNPEPLPAATVHPEVAESGTAPPATEPKSNGRSPRKSARATAEAETAAVA